MNTHRVHITFHAYENEYSDDPTALIHRIRNLAESIYYEIRGKRIATLLNMDTATDCMDLEVPSAGKKRRLMPVIRKCLAEHNFEAAEVDVVDTSAL